MSRKKYQIGEVVLYKKHEKSTTMVTHIIPVEPEARLKPYKLQGVWPRVGRKDINPATPEQTLRYKICHNTIVKLSDL